MYQLNSLSNHLMHIEVDHRFTYKLIFRENIVIIQLYLKQISTEIFLRGYGIIHRVFPTPVETSYRATPYMNISFMEFSTPHSTLNVQIITLLDWIFVYTIFGIPDYYPQFHLFNHGRRYIYHWMGFNIFFFNQFYPHL